MQITREMLQQRAEKLGKHADALRADLSATIGAIQDCGFWLAQLDIQETESPASNDLSTTKE